LAIKIIHQLPAQPFAQWLSERSKYYGGIKPLADEVGEDYTWIGKLINGKFKTVDLDRADSILCKDGTSHLREIWPELYEEF
jgi:hypothetical protein